MPRRYNAPPLQECVIEYRFQPSKPWALTVPGLLYPKVQAQYPEIAQENVLTVSMRPGAEKVSHEIEGGISRVRFKAADDSASLMLGPDILAISRVSGYPGWDTFKAEALSQLENYRAVGSPAGLTRVGVRYVNKISVDARGIELNDYFKAAPQLPEPIPQVYAAFNQVVQIIYPTPEMVLRFVFARGPNENDIMNYVLDLDIANVNEYAPRFEHVAEWLDVAHGRVEEAFDAVLTEKTHVEVLQEVK